MTRLAAHLIEDQIIEQILNEMPAGVNITGGYLDKKVIKKFKKKLKTADAFITRIKTKHNIDSSDERRLRAYFNEL